MFSNLLNKDYQSKTVLKGKDKNPRCTEGAHYKNLKLNLNKALCGHTVQSCPLWSLSHIDEITQN